jgi:hypothetical protein
VIDVFSERRYNYFGQQFSFPLLVTRGLEGWTSVGAFMLPLFGVLAATQFWLNPLRERKKREYALSSLISTHPPRYTFNAHH